MLAVPHGAVAGIVAELGEALAGKVVVDATNPLNDTYSDLTTSGVSAAEQLQQQVPGATVVKALNTVFASRYAAPTEDGQPLDAFLAGDDAQAKSTVERARLVAGLPAGRRSAACGWPARSRSSRSLNISPQRHATAGPGRAPSASSARRGA